MRNYPHVTEEVRSRVLASSAELGYRPNAIARNMRLGQTRSLGLVVRDMLSVNFAEICAAAEAVAEANDYDLFVCNSNRSPDKEKRYINSLLERQVAGVIVFVADDSVNNLGGVLDDGKAAVLVSTGLVDERIDRVDTCDEEASTEATRHLIELGHQRIAYLAWGQKIPSGRERLEGYRKAHEEAGIAVISHLVRHCEFDTTKAGAEVEFLMHQPEPPTALIISAANLVPGALGAIHALGLKPPVDLSVIAFDDRDSARLFNPPITVMRRRVSDVGRLAVELVLQRIADPAAPRRRAEVRFSLLQRGSTAPPRLRP